MSLTTAVNDKTIDLYFAARGFAARRREALKNRESGQANVEYLGLILIIAGALTLGFVGVLGATQGGLVDFVQNAIKSALNKALDTLHVN